MSENTPSETGSADAPVEKRVRKPRVAKAAEAADSSSPASPPAQSALPLPAVVLDADGSLAGIYRKMHIPDAPGDYEKFYFTPGDLGFNPIDTAVGRLGVLVCWDQWFPEAARAMALAGAQLLLYPSAIGWNPNDTSEEQQRQLQAWMNIQRGHAIANGLNLAACNRVGYEPDPSGVTSGVRFWGSSFVCGPQGEIIAQADDQAPKLLVAEVDLARTEQVRRLWPFLRDRRLDAYADLALRYRD